MFPDLQKSVVSGLPRSASICEPGEFSPFVTRFNPSRFFVLWMFSALLFCGISMPGAERYDPVFGDPLTESWRWRMFPELSGLGMQCMAEGRDGTMWFGATEGVWSFDGINWDFHPPQNSVSTAVSIARGVDGTMFFASRWEIWTLSNQKWTCVFRFADRSSGEFRKLIAARDGSIWAASSSGAMHFKDGQWTIYTSTRILDVLRGNRSESQLKIELLPEAILNRPRTNALPNKRYDVAEVHEDRGGRIWLGTDGGEILCFKSSSSSNGMKAEWQLYNEYDGIACGRNPSILQLTDGTLWVIYGSASGYLNVFDGATWKKFDLANAGVPADCGNLIQTRDGAVWLSGRYIISACRDGQWKNYQKPAVPVPSARNFIMQSSDGALWIAGPSTEIVRVDYQTGRWLTLPDLNFQCETVDGTQWFLHRDGRVVSRSGTQWTRYGTQDGLMDAPVALLGTKSGDIWAAGSHEHTAATARFDGKRWSRFIHDDLSWGVDWRAAFESSDGSIWFGAAVDSGGPAKHLAGILQFRNGEWIHHSQTAQAARAGQTQKPETILPATQRPEPIGKFLCLGESRDGKIWAGRSILVYSDGRAWQVFQRPRDTRLESRIGTIDAMLTTRERELWIGTRQFGALRYDGTSWQHYQGKDSLIANSVYSMAQADDGSIVMATDRGFCRYDGSTWTTDLLPAYLNVPTEGGSIKTTRSGALWVNRFSPEWTRRAWPKGPRLEMTNVEFWTVCHRFVDKPPKTFITSGPKEVSPPGNAAILWTGSTPWRQSDDSQLQFSFRLDDQPWSPYTSEGGHAFFTLPSGKHHFEVRARDRDFNVDPSPARLDFVVLPPVWRQGWFIVLIILLVTAIVAQSIRVLLEQDRLRKAHAELEDRVQERTTQLATANKELESFAYSVSHDLRAPLRSIDGFSRALLEDYWDKLDESGRENLRTVRAASQRMGRLIDDLLQLSRVGRTPLRRSRVNLSVLVETIAEEFRKQEPNRNVDLTIAPDCFVSADVNLIRIALENILGNAWKYTSRSASAKIEFGVQNGTEPPVFFVRDNGVGFDMTYSQKLFGAFQRLHSNVEFPGTGIGLATVQRIIHRHEGKVWIEGVVGQGATLYFTVPGNQDTL